MGGRKEQRKQGISYLWGEKTLNVRPCLLAINELNHHQQKKKSRGIEERLKTWLDRNSVWDLKGI
jgi:hypothetical protein